MSFIIDGVKNVSNVVPNLVGIPGPGNLLDGLFGGSSSGGGLFSDLADILKYGFYFVVIGGVLYVVLQFKAVLK